MMRDDASGRSSRASSGRSNLLPGLVVAVADGVVAKVDTRLSTREEVDRACQHLVALHAAGTAWRDMLLVAPGKRKWRDRIVVALDAASVPCRMLLGHPGAKPDPSDDLVHVTSVYGAEGLAFPAVVVMGLGDLPWKQQPLDEALRIVRAAVLAATASVAISYSKDSALVERLADA